MRLPEPGRSRAVLVGSGHYQSDGLKDLDAAVHNVSDLRDVLVDASLSTFTAATCEVVTDPASVADVLNPVKAAAHEAEDLLLVYFAGHGLLFGRNRELHLATTQASDDPWLSVSYRAMADLIESSDAKTKIVVLDCCYSGRAVDLPLGLTVNGFDIGGAYVLTSSSQIKRSIAAEGARNTAFTGRLLALMRDGLAGADDLLSMRTLYANVRDQLSEAGLPLPLQLDGNTAGSMALVRNLHPAAGRRLTSELREVVREEMSVVMRSRLEEMQVAMAALTRDALLPDGPARELRMALEAAPAVEPAVLSAVWTYGVALLPLRPDAVRFADLTALLAEAEDLTWRGDSAEHPYFRCLVAVEQQFPDDPRIRPLATWLAHHRPAGTNSASRGPATVRESAVVVLLAPAALPGRPVGRRGSRYEASMWLYTDTEGFTSLYPDLDRYGSAVPMTAAEAPARLGAVLYDGLDALARTPGAADPVVEFILPSELWDLEVENWRIGPNRGNLGLQYATVVRSLERLRDVESHQRWRQQWEAAGAELRRRGRVRLVCRSCLGHMSDLDFQDHLHRADQRGAVVLLEQQVAGRRNRDSLRAGTTAGVPGFLWLRENAASACAGPAVHRRTALVARTPAELARSALRLRQAAKPPFHQGFVLYWDDPNRMPHLDNPLAAPATWRRA
ncbi:caspase family protein [Actinoplanes sp. NPDC048796]|uniref:caspase, EACC1-associated type n=1 Tax=Actinoplanes sp. NPDC048796 TaxID=3155640 RepID=UPI0033D6619F